MSVSQTITKICNALKDYTHMSACVKVCVIHITASVRLHVGDTPLATQSMFKCLMSINYSLNKNYAITIFINVMLQRTT